jgi:hypothetical protein
MAANNQTLNPEVFNSIAFVLPQARPDACGARDYCIRMSNTLVDMGYRCAITATETVPADLHLSGTKISSVDPVEALNFDHIVIQYGPDLKAPGRRFMRQMKKLRHPSNHLMLHEFFRVNSQEYLLSLKDVIKSRIQLALLGFSLEGRSLNPHPSF